MTRATSPVGLDSPAPPAGDPAAGVERLEFGKFCLDPDGPVERDRENVPIEHGQLGWSAGFPEELLGFCDPSIMGTWAGELDPPPKHCPHGTIVRPVAPGGGRDVRSVFYRVQTRPEAGRGAAGRRYIMARYTVAREEGVSPLAFFNAMEETELSGVTREQAVSLEALPARAGEPALSREGEVFCRGALVYLLSGIPVSILEPVAEKEFFSWVAALWALLPPALRPHLSAGWGVGDSFSGRLTVTHTASRERGCALFSPSEPAWAGPEYMTTWRKGQPVEWPFRPPNSDKRQVGANCYTRYFFGPEREWPVPPAPAFDAKALAFINSLPEEGRFLSEMPDWGDPFTVKIFRRPGLKVRDELSLSLVGGWLRAGYLDEEVVEVLRPGLPQPQAFPAIGADDEVLSLLHLRGAMSYESTRLRALRLMLEALKDDASRPRADEALWVSLSERYPDSYARLVEEARGPWSARAQLLAALCRPERGTLDVLGRLSLAAEGERGERGEAEDLPAVSLPSLRKHLADSVRPDDAGGAAQAPGADAGDCLRPHAALLQLATPPAAYREWLSRGGLLLMRAFAYRREDFGQAPHDDIIRLSPSPDRRALHEMMFGHEGPQAALSAVGSLSEEQYRVFADVFNAELERADAARRDHLLTWSRALGLLHWHRAQGRVGDVSPLLLIDADEAPAQDAGVRGAQLDRLAGDVARGGVPPSLLAKVSAFCLRHWDELGGLIQASVAQRRVEWVPVVSLWPALYADALSVLLHNMQPPPPEVERAARELVIRPQRLNETLERRIVRADFWRVAALFWNWATYWREGHSYRPDDYQPPNAIDICWYVVNRRLPPRPPNLRDAIENFVRLAHDSGGVETLMESSRDFWHSATEGWQAMLVLTLFPHERLDPTPQQLGRLVLNQEWLSSHLGDPQISAERRAAFHVATVPFQGLPYDQHWREWRNEFRQSVVWAAFSGVPDVGSLPPRALSEALTYYCRVPRAGDWEQMLRRREAKAHMCYVFLYPYLRSRDFEPAVRRVLFEFVLPELVYAYRKEGTEAVFEAFIAELSGRRKKNLRIPEGISGEFYGLLEFIVRNTTQRLLGQAVEAYLWG